MARILIGRKIRDQRRARGLTQAALAAQLGISASYLNLIEGDRRNIAGALLKRVADLLDVPVDDFDGAAERRLVDDLGEITGDALTASLQLSAADAAELVARQPHWARALVTLHRATIDERRAVGALSDRLTQDPFLADAVHGLLTHLTAIRSASEILESTKELEPRQRERFVSIIAGDSRRMTDVAQALASFFGKAHAAAGSVTPVEEVEDFLFEHDAHFPQLELATETLLDQLGESGGASEGSLLAWLRLQGVQVLFDGSAGTAHGWAPDAPAKVLRLPEHASASSRRFDLARAVASIACAEAIASQLQRAPQLQSQAARHRAGLALLSSAAAALLMPYAAFHAAALAERYDVDRLALRFGASFEQACQRLIGLRRRGSEGVRFGFLRADSGGFVSKRLPLPRLALPRYGNACPLWPVYQAFQRPGATLRELVEFPGGERYLMVARAIDKGPPRHGAPRRLLSVMLFCHALEADRLVYGDGLDLSPTAPATPVGGACRTCARQACGWRQEDPILDAGIYRQPSAGNGLDLRPS